MNATGWTELFRNWSWRASEQSMPFVETYSTSDRSRREIDPLFEVASEEEAQSIADEAFDDWFETILADPPEGVRRILRRRSGRSSPREQLRSAVNDLRDHRDFPASWRRHTFERDRTIDALMTELSALGALGARSSWPEDYLARNLVEISRFAEETNRLEAVRGRDYDGL